MSEASWRHGPWIIGRACEVADACRVQSQNLGTPSQFPISYGEMFERGLIRVQCCLLIVPKACGALLSRVQKPFILRIKFLAWRHQPWLEAQARLISPADAIKVPCRSPSTARLSTSALAPLLARSQSRQPNGSDGPPGEMNRPRVVAGCVLPQS